MIRPEPREQAETAAEAVSSDAPEALRFPPRERPTTIRRPERVSPFDLEDDDAEAFRTHQAVTAAADRARKAADEERSEAEKARDAAERDRAIREARAALAGHGPSPELASVVWDAHEAIAASQNGEGAEGRPEYVPIARESRGFTTPTAIERLSPSVYVAPYNLPERSPNPQQTPMDLLRRVVVSALAAAFAVLALLLAAHGGPGSVFDAARSPLAPLAPAALGWPVLGLAAVAAAAHGWVPDQLSARRQRSVGLPLAASSAAGLLWCVAASAGIAWVSLLAALALLASSGEGVRRLNLLTARTRRERWLTDAPLEAALGWGAFATAWSLTAAAADGGWLVAPVTLWSSLLLMACMVPVCVAGMTERGRIVPAVAFGWGAVWLMAARLLGEHQSAVLMVLAGVGGVVALLTALARRQEVGHTERLALAGLPTA